MEIIRNNNFSADNKNTIISLSGFGAERDTGKTIQNIFKYSDKNNFNALTFEKPGFQGGNGQRKNEKFSLEQMKNEIGELITLIKGKQERIILIGNSMISLPMLELGSTVENILLLSPVLDIEYTIKQFMTLNGIQGEINEEIIQCIGEHKNTKIDINKFLSEMRENSQAIKSKRLQEACRLLGEKLTIFTNPKDKLINYDFLKSISEKSNNNLVITNSLPGDNLHHSIDTREFLVSKYV